jgi:predicted outer membrane protein
MMLRMLLHGAALLLLLLAAVAHAQQTATTHPGDGEHARSTPSSLDLSIPLFFLKKFISK